MYSTKTMPRDCHFILDDNSHIGDDFLYHTLRALHSLHGSGHDDSRYRRSLTYNSAQTMSRNCHFLLDNNRHVRDDFTHHALRRLRSFSGSPDYHSPVTILCPAVIFEIDPSTSLLLYLFIEFQVTYWNMKPQIICLYE